MRNLAALGYGRVEVCSLTFFTSVKMFTDDLQWDTPRWHTIISTIVDECSQLGMIVDINNGDAYPTQMPSVMDADDPASAYEITFSELDVAAGTSYKDVIPERRKDPRCSKNNLLDYGSVLAEMLFPPVGHLIVYSVSGRSYWMSWPD